MTVSLIILADGPSPNLVGQLGASAWALYGRLLGDTVAVARRLPGARVAVRYNPGAPRALLAALPPDTEAVPAPTAGAAAVAAALADGLAEGGPALVLGGNLPHLPPWRLRDAATHLAGEAELVVGPSDRASWYLIGLRPAAAGLLGAMPAPGAALDGLLAAGRGHAVHRLPPWFSVDTVGDLGSLAEVLRTMPPEVAGGTRSMVEAGQVSRAVGG
ncbi:MAG TPA: DUF2064 domain-containing protein [Chloroflexaceae bacterium]|nr:DUF2064 domain-containing protein [Chloroflexaceae bacterium]